MNWIRACNTNSLNNGDLISFDYNIDNNDNNNKKILIAKVQDKSMQLMEYVLMSMLICQQDS
jgi:hypothetical protein